MAARFAIGIDVGGTKTAAGLVDTTTGEVLSERIVATRAEEGGEAVLGRVVGLAVDLKQTGEVDRCVPDRIGVGIAELVDVEGRVASDHTIAWTDLDYEDRLNAVLPTKIDSDIRTAALAETRYGQGKAFDSFAYVSVGTGIGGCLVVEGRPWEGARGNAMILGSGALTAMCDTCGVVSSVLEEIASGPAIVRGFRDAGGKADRCEDVFEMAQAGDATAGEVLDRAGHALGVSVAFMMNLTDPEGVIVGGGVGLAGGRFWEAFVASTRLHIWAATTREVSIVQSDLGASAAYRGAALKARMSGHS